MLEPSAPRRPQRRRARTPAWAKLWSFAVFANASGFLVAIWAARLVRAVPTSSGTQSALLAGYYAAIALAAVADALLIDELAFGGAFRKTHIQGKLARFAHKDAPVEDVVVTLQRSTMSFPFLLLVAGTLTYFLFNLVNGDFDAYFRRVGKHVSALQLGSVAEQRLAIEELSIRREPAVLPALRSHLLRGGETAPVAAWALGRFGDLKARRGVVDVLRSAARGDRSNLRHEARVSLGRLQDRASAELLRDELRDQNARGEPIDLRLLYGLGAVQTLESVPLLRELLHAGSSDTQRMAAWALAQHRDQNPCAGRNADLMPVALVQLCAEPWAQEGGSAVVRILEERLPSSDPEVRCAIVHALGILAHERSNFALMRALDSASASERARICPRLELSMRPDGANTDRADLFMPQDVFEMKVIMSMAQMRATDPGVRAKVEPWLAALHNDPGASPAAREAARSLLAGVREARDDKDAQSIEAALGIADPPPP